MTEERLKVCTGTCKLAKNISYFNKNKSKKDGLNTICKECSALVSRKYYSLHKERQYQQINQLKKSRITKNKEALFAYLSTHCCVDCGEKDPVVLEFDHLADKKDSISKMLSTGASLSSIEQEIAKCEIRCANCHRRKTAKDQNWYKYLMGL